MPFVPNGYVLLHTEINNAGEVVSKGKGAPEWLPELRIRTAAPTIKEDKRLGYWSKPELELARAKYREVTWERLLASNAAEAHCLEAWRIWLNIHPDDSQIKNDPDRLEKREMSQLAQAFFDANPLSVNHVTAITDRIDKQFGIGPAVKFRDKIEDHTRQQLYAGQVTSWVMNNNGVKWIISKDYWGTNAGGDLIELHTSWAKDIPVQSIAHPMTVTGHVYVAEGSFSNPFETILTAEISPPAVEQETPGHTSITTLRRVADVNAGVNLHQLPE